MIISVTQYNNFLKALVENEPMLAKVEVCGEVSNLKITNESIFFSLKDAFCQMECFAYYDKFINGLQNGCEVIVRGSSTVLKSGKNSFFVNKIILTQDKGEQYKKLTQLKERLSELGLFDVARKKTLPRYVFNIGVVTSLSGAVLHDIFDVISRRNRYAKLQLYDVRVQGENASAQIAQGIRFFDTQDVDVVIVARGGGGREDLSPFDSEEVAYALRDCSKTTISAVGHETDFSICDFVADLRAGTPSIAAEIVTNFSVDDDFEFLINKIKNSFFEKLSNAKIEYEKMLYYLENSILNSDLKAKNNLNLLMERCMFLLKTVYDRKYSESFLIKNKIDLLSPMRSLTNGRAMVLKANKKVTEIKEIKIGDSVDVYLSDGKFNAKVEKLYDEI